MNGLFIAGLLLGLGVGIFIGNALGLHSMRDVALKAGKIEYYLDGDNTKQWRWK